MEKGATFIFLLIALCIHLCDGYATENAQIGFERVRYEGPESSNQQVCLVVTGRVTSSFNVVVNTHEGIAGEYTIS